MNFEMKDFHRARPFDLSDIDRLGVDGQVNEKVAGADRLSESWPKSPYNHRAVSVEYREKNRGGGRKVDGLGTVLVALVRTEEEGPGVNSSGQFGSVAGTKRDSDRGFRSRREMARRSGCGILLRILGGARLE